MKTSSCLTKSCPSRVLGQNPLALLLPKFFHVHPWYPSLAKNEFSLFSFFFPRETPKEVSPQRAKLLNRIS